MARVNVASLHGRGGDAAGARIQLVRAIAVLERDPRPDPAALATATHLLALSLHATGDRRRGHEVALLAVGRTHDVFGPGSPELVRPMCSLARLELAVGDPGGARRHLEWALVTAEQAFGPEHELTATVHLELASLARERRRSRARTGARRANARRTTPRIRAKRGARQERWGHTRGRYSPPIPHALASCCRTSSQCSPSCTRPASRNRISTPQAEAVASRTLAEAEFRLGGREQATALRARAVAVLDTLEARGPGTRRARHDAAGLVAVNQAASAT